MTPDHYQSPFCPPGKGGTSWGMSWAGLDLSALGCPSADYPFRVTPTKKVAVIAWFHQQRRRHHFQLKCPSQCLQFLAKISGTFSLLLMLILTSLQAASEAIALEAVLQQCGDWGFSSLPHLGSILSVSNFCFGVSLLCDILNITLLQRPRSVS